MSTAGERLRPGSHLSIGRFTARTVQENEWHAGSLGRKDAPFCTSRTAAEGRPSPPLSVLGAGNGTCPDGQPSGRTRDPLPGRWPAEFEKRGRIAALLVNSKPSRSASSRFLAPPRAPRPLVCREQPLSQSQALRRHLQHLVLGDPLQRLLQRHPPHRQELHGNVGRRRADVG